jgi:hypothetical protein
MLCVHNFKDYYNQIANSKLLKKTEKNILFNIKLTQNAMTLTKTAKKTKLSSKMLNLHFFLFMIRFFVIGPIKKQTTQKFMQYKESHLNAIKSVLKIFTLNNLSKLSFFNDISTQKALESINISFSKFLTLSPVIFANFIKNLLANTDWLNITPNNFNITLQKNLIVLIERVLQKFKYHIYGIKIICLGR